MKKTIGIVLIVLVVISTISGCGVQPLKNAEEKTITDLNGNKVIIPQTITGASSNAASVTTHIVMIGGSDIVKIAPASFKTGHTEEFERFFNGTDKIKLSDGNKISAENLLTAGVNLFFTTKQDEADEYSKAGLTCVVLNYDTIENIAETFRVIGIVLGGEAEKKANTISQYILNCKAKVEEYNNDGESKSPVTVYYISASTQTTPYITQGLGTSTDTLLEMCGVKLISPGKGLDVQTNPEFIIENDPDYILIDGYLAEEAYKALLSDQNLKDLKAVKYNHIVIAPVGYFRPILRPGAETGLGLLWLAKTFQVGEIDETFLEDYALNFYNDCFGFGLVNEDIHSMLNWTD